jgi:hypothetical protein
MDIHIEKKGALYVCERFYIRSLSAQELQMNDTYANIVNLIFDRILSDIP